MATLVALAEVPWPDDGTFAASVWISAQSLNHSYVTGSPPGSPDVIAGAEAVKGYLRVAESAGAVGWATLLRHALQDADELLTSADSAEPRTAPVVAYSNANLMRLERLRGLIDDGASVPEAAARAFLEVPRLDGVVVSPRLSEALQAASDSQAVVEASDLHAQLGQLRNLAMENDAPEYVAAVDLLLDALPEEPGDADEATQATVDADPLGAFLDHPEFLAAAAWLHDTQTDASIESSGARGRGRVGVDYSSHVPRSLFDPSGMAQRWLAEEAFVASGATTLLEAIEYAATSASPQLRRVLGASRWSFLVTDGDRLVDELRTLVSREDARVALIIEQRLLADDPATLSELGDSLGLTRERVRQLQKGIEQSLTGRPAYAARLGSLLRHALGDLSTLTEFEQALRRAVPGDNDEVAVKLARRQVTMASGYRFTETTALAASTSAVMESFPAAVEACTDERGFVDEERLWSGMDVSTNMREALVQSQGLQRICGFLMRNGRQRCRVYAAMRSLGKPSTAEEVTELLGDSAFEHIGNVLSSADDIVKASKDQWALSEWVDRPYGGIAEEIAFRIERDGGVTTVDSLMEELPERYRVSKHSVNMYLGTPRFEVRHGEVRLSTQMQSRHKPLDHLSSVVFSPTGTPILAVRMEDRYLSGYSIVVPQAVAQQLEVGIDESVLLPVHEPPGCQEVSVIWRSHSVAGPHIGRVREALSTLEVCDGETFYIALNPSGLSFMKDLPFTASGTPTEVAVDDGTEASVSAVIERMRARRKL